jgi:hypothetical protein
MQSAMAIFVLSFVNILPVIASGLSFDYTLGSHRVSIVDSFNNHLTWSEGVDPTASFTLVGSEYVFSPVDSIRYYTDDIRNASAASANALFGTMGVKASAVDVSKALHAEVQSASADVQMGGAFIITGQNGTVDLKVRTTLDGTIGVLLQQMINNRSIISFDMTATSQNIDNYFNSSAGWSIYSLSGLDQGGNPIEEPGLYQTGLPFSNDRISSTGSYEFNNYEFILTLDGVKTNQLFNLDLSLRAEISGPDLGGTIGDQVDFFNTYGMGFTSNPAQWFELPNGYSITAGNGASIPEPSTFLLLGAGLGGLALLRRKSRK